MLINNYYKKILVKIFIVIALFECLYLFALPYCLTLLAESKQAKDFINSKINADIIFSKPKFKTHIYPALSLYLQKFEIKNNQNTIISLDDTDIEISVLQLLFKKIKLNHIYMQNMNANIKIDEEGNFDLKTLFPQQENKSFKLCFNNSDINIKTYNFNVEDEYTLNKYVITGNPFILKKQNKKINITTAGKINTTDQKSSFEANVTLPHTINFQKINKNSLNGKIFLYNFDTNILLSYLKQIKDLNVSKIQGNIEYLQASIDNNDITLNAKFKDIIFNKNNWKNHIYAKGENKISANVELNKNIIQIHSFNYKAYKIDISAGGDIKLEDKPVLDIKGAVKDSRAENIASILPPTLIPQYMTIEKVKNYGVYGDLNSNINIKGKVPQPDITGYVNGRNIHVLDKSFHKTHTGKVDIEFNKRLLNMDIDVDMQNNQKANINGYVYMYRDGTNNVNVKTTKHLNFPVAQKIVVPVSKVLNFQLGPIPDMNIKEGEGNIDINIQGNVDTVNINGNCFFDKARFSYNGFFGEAKNVKGQINFKEDVITVKSEKAYVKNNPVNVEGSVKLNDNLDFDITANKADADDLIEIINKSELLKEVKKGMVVIDKAAGFVNFYTNIKAKIVPVPYGSAPLPPEEAFTDMTTNGYVQLLGNRIYLYGFNTPINNIKGKTYFTETTVDLKDITGIVETSPIHIEGKIITDIENKIPDIDITVTSPSVNLKDTIKFLTESYIYPDEYPDISYLYNISSKHDLYFKYKAKAVDFVIDKAYAKMNFIEDSTDDILKATSGSIILDKANVKVNDIKADFYNQNLTVKGNVNRIDTKVPIYNLSINTDNFNLEHLNEADKIEIIPNNAKRVISEFQNYKGFADINIDIIKNKLNGKINFYKPQFEHLKTGIPLYFDDFIFNFNHDKLKINNLTALLDNMPLYMNLEVSDISKNPDIKGYFTSKLKNEFVKKYTPKDIAEKLELTGDINLSSQMEGTIKNLTLKPKLTLQKEADIYYNKTNIGNSNDKRDILGKINITEDKITIANMDYVKYISSQNQKIYPINYASLNGTLNIDKTKNIQAEEINFKINQNLSAKIINWFLPKPVLQQGTLNCDIKYTYDKLKNIAKIIGNIDCRNIDIPLFDTVIKHIKVAANEENIELNVFGFITDGRVVVDSKLENNIIQIPKIESLNIFAEQIDNNKLLEEFYKTKQAINTTNKENNLNIPDLVLENGHLEIQKLTIKSLVANNITSHFSINETGNFFADDINIEIGEGDVKGQVLYDLNTTDFTGNFELNNVDSKYVAEALFGLDNQITGSTNGKIILSTRGLTHEEAIKNLSGVVYFDIYDGWMPKLGSLEYLLRAGNIVKKGITGLTINSVLELLNLVKTGYFSNINGSCIIDNGIAENIEIYSKGENLSLYISGSYDIVNSYAQMEILGNLSDKISTIFGAVGNTSLNTFFKLIPGISLIDFSRNNFADNVEKIPSFTNGNYEARTFQAIIDGDINKKSGYVKSFKWVKTNL